MAAYEISYYLYRSNPVIMRRIEVPGTLTVRDLTVALCLGMGLGVSECVFLDERNEPADEKMTLQELFGNGADFQKRHGKLIAYQDSKRQELMSLTFLYDVTATLEELLREPVVLGGTGIILPEKVYQAGLINELQSELAGKESCVINGAGTFYREQQLYHQKKLQNLIYGHFSPEKALALKTNLAVPMEVVLENWTLKDLARLADMNNIYIYEKRKAFYVGRLSDRLIDNVREVFAEMSIFEYLDFRHLMLTGDARCADQFELEQTYPALFHNGMISLTKKNGPLLCARLVKQYESWFDTEQEIVFREDKRLEQVACGCAEFYGIFTKKQFRAVLDRYYPGEVRDASIDQFWKYEILAMGIARAQSHEIDEGADEVAYDMECFDQKELPLYLKALVKDETPRMMTDIDDFELVSRDTILLRLKNYMPLNTFINRANRGYVEIDFGRTPSVLLAINCLRKSYSIQETARLTAENMRYYWGSREKLQKELVPYLEELAKEVPRVLLYGYTAAEAKENGVKPLAERTFAKLLAEEKEQERLAMEQRKKKAEAAKAAKKTSGSTGRGRRR